MARAIPIEEEIGKKYGRLTVLRFDQYKTRKDGSRAPVYEFVCDCGTSVKVVIYAVRFGNTLSCGCRQRDRAAEVSSVIHKTHGQTNTPEFAAWHAMIQRTTNPRASAYKNYGGRGIKTCQSWIDSFALFLADMGRRPTPQHSIDRIDNDGPYSPENCRWATLKEQANNRRTNRKIEHDGAILSVSQWAAITSIKPKVLYDRLRDGWSASEALATPVRKKAKQASACHP